MLVNHHGQAPRLRESRGDMEHYSEQGPLVVMRGEAAWGYNIPLTPDALAAEALARMEKHAITALLVADAKDPSKLLGIIHLHDLLKAGVV